jgi:predicted enzyme related to lactoylglutathione lyase
MGFPVTWFETNGPEPEQAAKFYSELFGWHTRSMPEANYVLLDTFSGGGINGGIGVTREGQMAHNVIYVEGLDIQALLDTAESMGAKTVVPRRVVPDMVTFAQFTDPIGNLIGLIEGDGSTRISDGDNPQINWFEIASVEPKRSWDFYGELFGWEIEESSGDGYVHGEVDTGQGIPGGIGQSQSGKPGSQVYAQVDDLHKYLERAGTLGGRTIVEPMSVGDDTSIALFADPQGNTFGLYVQQH